MNRKRHFHSFQFSIPGTLIAIIVLICTVWSCNSRVDGCLDIEAANFDVTVDRHDPEDCRYPDLLVRVQYSWDTLSFSKGISYTNDLGQLLIFEDVYVLVSQFALNGVELGRMVVEDRVEWFLNEGAGGMFINAIDDFTFIDQSKFSFVLGEWRQTDVIDRMDFYVGVPDTLTPTDVTLLNEDHPLRESRAFYNEVTDEFATARFIVALDTARMNVDTFVVSSGPIALSFPLEQELTRGRNDEIGLKIDFYTIFRDVDMRLDSASIAEKLASNLEAAVGQ